MKSLEFQSVVYKEGKYFVAQCLDIDISSFGDSAEEALVNLKEALDLYLEDSATKTFKHVKNPTLHTVHLQNA